MKILKYIGIGVLIIIAIPLIVALFTQKDYHVEKEIVIDKPKQEVFNYIKYLKNQDKYSVWNRMDPNMVKSYRGTDGSVGFVSTWDSQNPDVGKGEQEIKKIDDGERIDFELRFFEPFESTEPAYMITESIADSQTKVKWGFSGHMDYPMNIMLVLMNMEELIGNDLQMGLNNLKKELDS